jgi:hypothetical protein
MWIVLWSCPNGHPLGPAGKVLVGHQACLGHGGGHTTWTCRTCDQTLYGPPLNIHCTTLDGPATVRISIRRESWRVPAIHTAVVVGHHQGVLLIGAPYQCNSLLGATSGVGLELSPRDRTCANGQPRRARDGRRGDDPPEIRAHEADQQQDGDELSRSLIGR